MERRSCYCFLGWNGRMHDGCRRFQSQVVGRIPCHCLEYLQCICKQLVVGALCASLTGFPQVSLLSIYAHEVFIKQIADTTFSRLYVRITHFSD